MAVTIMEMITFLSLPLVVIFLALRSLAKPVPKAKAKYAVWPPPPSVGAAARGIPYDVSRKACDSARTRAYIALR